MPHSYPSFWAQVCPTKESPSIQHRITSSVSIVKDQNGKMEKCQKEYWPLVHLVNTWSIHTIIILSQQFNHNHSLLLYCFYEPKIIKDHWEREREREREKLMFLENGSDMATNIRSQPQLFNLSSLPKIIVKDLTHSFSLSLSQNKWLNLPNAFVKKCTLHIYLEMFYIWKKLHNISSI